MLSHLLLASFVAEVSKSASLFPEDIKPLLDPGKKLKLPEGTPRPGGKNLLRLGAGRPEGMSSATPFSGNKMKVASKRDPEPPQPAAWRHGLAAGAIGVGIHPLKEIFGDIGRDVGGAVFDHHRDVPSNLITPEEAQAFVDATPFQKRPTVGGFHADAEEAAHARYFPWGGGPEAYYNSGEHHVHVEHAPGTSKVPVSSLAHELGHAQNYDTGLGEARRLMRAVGTPVRGGLYLGGALAGEHGDSKTDYLFPAATLATHLPHLLEEGLATHKGLKMVGQHHPQALSSARKGLAGAFATYAARPLGDAALSLAVRKVSRWSAEATRKKHEAWEERQAPKKAEAPPLSTIAGGAGVLGLGALTAKSVHDQMQQPVRPGSVPLRLAQSAHSALRPLPGQFPGVGG